MKQGRGYLGAEVPGCFEGGFKGREETFTKLRRHK